MEKSSKRGKIPQSDWPLIMARYEAGETLASIARTYDCSPPAISYVVSRSRARHPGSDNTVPAPSAGEPHLIKAAAADGAAVPGTAIPAAAAPPANGAHNPAAAPRQDEAPPAPRPAAAAPVAERRDAPPRGLNGFAGLPPRAPIAAPRPPLPPGSVNGDQRRTLHLSLGNSSGNGNSHPAEPDAPAGFGPAPSRPGGGEGSVAASAAAPASEAAPERLRERPAGFADASTADFAPARQTQGNGARRDGGGSYIDHELRTRVDGDIAAFLAAFDTALVQDTQESRSALREATDRLLRAGARTRIELERLEARLPLPRRDNGGGPVEASWRQR
jgi:hypothetical protein